MIPDFFTTRTIDQPVIDDWFGGGMYAHIKEYVKEVDICVDVGAAIGVASYYMLIYFKPKQLICFEPDNANFMLLEQNLYPFENATLINRAVFYGKETVGVYGTGDGSSLGYMVADIDPEHSSNWPMLYPYVDKIFLCTELEKHIRGADLIKIDVEGSEYNIIEHSPLVQNCRYLLLETHNHERPYVEDYLRSHLPRHRTIYTQGADIHFGFLLEHE